jgi:cell division septation protein DedD
MSMKNHLTDRDNVIGEFSSANCIMVILTAVPLLIMGGTIAHDWYDAQPARQRDYWYVPTKQPIPQTLQEAGRLSFEIERYDATWKAEMDDLMKLIEGQKPGEFDLSNEIATTDALRAYVAKLLRAGESAVETFVRMKATTRTVNELLKQAAPKFREMAALAQRFADETRRAEIKQNYQALADIWEAKAKAAEIHQNDVAANLNNDLLDYIKDQNVFMERLLTMLNQGLVSKDLRELARFRTTLQEIIIKHEFLRGAIRTWRARMLGEPSAPQPEPEPQKSGAEPAAPPPQVKHVAFSTPMPAVPPNPSYWDQVRQQESRWEDEMHGLLTLVQEQPPAALQEPRAAVSACIEQKMSNADRTSSYFEYLVRHGDAIEAGLIKVQRMAQRLCDLLEQNPAAEPSLGSRPLTEHGIRWAVAAIRRGEEPAKAAAILGRVIRDELALIAGLARDLRDVNIALRRHFHRPEFPDLDRTRVCPWNFSETIQHAVELQEGIRDRLGASRVKILSELSVPEPERRPAPEGPKAKRPPSQPATRQASFQPPPSPRPEPKPLTNETIAALTVRKHEASPEEMNRIMRWPAPHWLVPTTR